MSGEHAEPRFEDDEFSRLAIDLGYVTHEDMQRCKQIQSRTVGRRSKYLETIALEHEVLSEKEIEELSKGKRKSTVPERIAGYEIRSILGKGGLGTVYRAFQTSMKRDVALKVLADKWTSDYEFRKRFLLEARIVGKLSHRNLIQVFDVGQEDGRYYFSMERIDGTTVQELISQGPLDPVAAIDIVIQIADAVRYIDVQGLVHRDIKPSNILLTRRGVAKLGDFGFVKSNIDHMLMKQDYILGTPDYISPEQAMGNETIDSRSDIYSLGATFYHMVSGCPPFDGSESTILRQHVRVEPPSIREVAPSLPNGLSRVIERMMSKHPEDRYPDAGDLIQDLRMVKMQKKFGGKKVDAGRSTLIEAVNLGHVRTEKQRRIAAGLRQEIDRLQTQVRWLMISLVFTMLILAAVVIVHLLMGGGTQ
ncbi:MAG: serine/threonine-protein kinase [Planctomycetota bacterium]|jgi:serine/threonine-protein kinase|nr:serine/threonine-protein kinase [Planctomycetota bacterium]